MPAVRLWLRSVQGRETAPLPADGGAFEGWLLNEATQEAAALPSGNRDGDEVGRQAQALLDEGGARAPLTESHLRAFWAFLFNRPAFEVGSATLGHVAGPEGSGCEPDLEGLRKAFVETARRALHAGWPHVPFEVHGLKSGMLAPTVPMHHVTVVWEAYPDAPDEKAVGALLGRLRRNHPAFAVLQVRAHLQAPLPQSLAAYEAMVLEDQLPEAAPAPTPRRPRL